MLVREPVDLVGVLVRLLVGRKGEGLAVDRGLPAAAVARIPARREHPQVAGLVVVVEHDAALGEHHHRRLAQDLEAAGLESLADEIAELGIVGLVLRPPHIERRDSLRRARHRRARLRFHPVELAEEDRDDFARQAEESLDVVGRHAPLDRLLRKLEDDDVVALRRLEPEVVGRLRDQHTVAAAVVGVAAEETHARQDGKQPDVPAPAGGPRKLRRSFRRSDHYGTPLTALPNSQLGQRADRIARLPSRSDGSA